MYSKEVTTIKIIGSIQYEDAVIETALKKLSVIPNIGYGRSYKALDLFVMNFKSNQVNSVDRGTIEQVLKN